jgi:hypothetical protein
MNAARLFRCSLATPGVEVVTSRAGDGSYTSQIHGGRLDGQHFTCFIDPEAQHEKVCRLARMAEWPRAPRARVRRRR